MIKAQIKSSGTKAKKVKGQLGRTDSYGKAGPGKVRLFFARDDKTLNEEIKAGKTKEKGQLGVVAHL